MMNRAALLSLAAVAALAAAAVAQSPAPQPPLPAGPLLKQADDFSTWQITYAYASDPKPDADSPKPTPHAAKADSVSAAAPHRLTVTRTKPLWHAVLETTDGRRTENWSDGSSQIFKSDALARPMQVPNFADGRPLFPNYDKLGFPDLEWVSARTYTGVNKVGGRDCLTFESSGATAYIDAETRYPVLWKQAKETRTFVQLAAPTEKIVLPPDVAQTAQILRRDRERAKKLPPP